jgi:Cu/Ag efflux protein CusF
VSGRVCPRREFPPEGATQNFGNLSNFMQNYLIILMFAAAVSFACGKSAPETKPPNAKTAQTPAAAAPSVPKDGNYDGKGEVTKINMESGSIELRHEDMPGLMPPMQMEFFVRDKALQKGLAVGDKVDFVVEYKHPTEIITSIKKAQ